MKQKQKIIIFLSFLLCGSPIIFLAFRDHEQKKKKNNQQLINNSSAEKQKNNLKINQQEIKKKKKKKKSNPIAISKENKSSSFLFWIIIITVMIILVLIAIIIYKKKKKKKNNLNNFIDDEDSSSSSLTTEKQKNETEKQLNPLEEQKLLKCGIDYNLNFNFQYSEIVIVISKNYQKLNSDTIKKVFLESFTSKKQSLPPEVTNKDFYQNIPPEYFQNILQAMVNFLEKYITIQLLNELYNLFKNTEINGINYPILMTMSEKFNLNHLNINEQISLYNIKILFQKNEKDQKVTKDDIAKINNGQYFDLLKDILNRDQVTSFLNQKKNKKYLFLKLFKFYKFFEQLFQELKKLMENKDQYANTLKEMQIDKDNIEKLIAKSA